MANLALADQGQDPSAPEDAGAQRAGSKKELYRRAAAAFEQTEKRFPESKAAQEARLGQATVFEELGQWDEAMEVLSALEKSYPVKQIIKIRMTRIRERLARQNPPIRRK